MSAVRIPAWLDMLLERYHSEASHLFLLHGNVRDVHPFGPEHVPLVDGLKRLFAQRAITVSYDVSAGFTFPDAAREKAFRKALGIKTGPLPFDPPRALALIDALLTSDRAPLASVSVVLDYAHALVPAGGGSTVERQSITTLARWATQPGVAKRRPLILLIAPSAGEVSD